MEDLYSTALTEAGFSEDDVALLELAEREHGLIQNWAAPTFGDVLDRVRGVAAAQAVSAAKGPSVAAANTSSVLPDRPPYLFGKDGSEVARYDPEDPSQYWEDPATHELWRWDGKRDRHADKAKMPINEQGTPIPRQRFPFGEPRRVVLVSHRTVDGVAIPDAVEVQKANLGEFDWYHAGLKVWIGGGGKSYRDPDPERVHRVKMVRERLGAGGNPAIVRG